ILDSVIETTKKQLFTYNKNRIEIDLDKLRSLKTPIAYLFPLLSPYGFTDWLAIEDLLEAESGRKVYSSTHVLLKDRSTWILEEITQQELDEKPVEELVDSLEGMLEIVEVESFDKGDADTLYIDKESLNHRLSVRNWQKGDYFYPMGMGGKRKKLSKFYKDIKLDVLKKPRQWLLCDGDEIVWVIGQRADERFKVTDKTKKILRIKVIK
ncbi:MAG: tRNA lysidine(34) synthetase TilS, partial [Bacteroidia bacterium]|nr:tRNA lysidine(34) synthetase TilS [Bacteroidia bacterium]